MDLYYSEAQLGSLSWRGLRSPHAPSFNDLTFLPPLGVKLRRLNYGTR